MTLTPTANYCDRQWDFFQKNLGEWHGSFVKYAPDGSLIDELPTMVTVTPADGQSVQIAVDYLTDRERNVTWTFGSVPGDMLCFENGEFSRGDKWVHGLSNAGFEQGLIHPPSRLRAVQVYKAGELEKVVLIHESLSNHESLPNSPEQGPPLTPQELVGVWAGEAISWSVRVPEPSRYSTRLQVDISGNQLIQQLSFGDRTLSSSATINGAVLQFNNSPVPMQMLLLPGGASSSCPLKIPTGHPFVAELGWLLSTNLRQRMIRSYDKSGNWESTTLVKERRA
ncbi:MAG: DUF3598 family protein [Cyanobacteria bacterium P01_A01_bin.3]